MNRVPSLPELVEQSIEQNRSDLCLSYRQDNRWMTLNADDILQQINNWIVFWDEKGLQPGQTVGLMCASSPFWMMMDVAIMACGGVTVPLFENISEDHLKFQVEQAEVAWVCVDSDVGRELLDRVCDGVDILDLGGAGGCALNSSPLAGAVPLKTREELGSKLKNISPNDLATIIYTSGSTGTPKGVELTHANLLSQVYGTQERFALNPGAIALSCLPLAHIFERMVLYFYIASGTHLYFVDDIQNLGPYIKDVEPHSLTVVPRILEKIKIRIDEKIMGMPCLMKQCFASAVQWAQDNDYMKQAPLRYRMVYRILRKAVGKRMQYLIVGGAALDPMLANFYLNLGIEVYQGYGLTESSPVIAANYPGHNRPGTVGCAFPDVEMRIAEDGEVLARGPLIMRGYHKNEQATEEVIDAEGWLHTGDLGAIDEDGFLKITGRKKEICKLSTGKYVSPVYVEQKLQQDTWIDTAVVIADGHNFVTALLFINDSMWDEFCSDYEMKGLRDDEILSSFDFKKVIDAIIEAVNVDLNAWEQVKRYVCVREPLNIESGLLTPTLKLRRTQIETYFKEDIQSLYS